MCIKHVFLFTASTDITKKSQHVNSFKLLKTIKHDDKTDNV